MVGNSERGTIDGPDQKSSRSCFLLRIRRYMQLHLSDQVANCVVELCKKHVLNDDNLFLFPPTMSPSRVVSPSTTPQQTQHQKADDRQFPASSIHRNPPSHVVQLPHSRHPAPIRDARRDLTPLPGKPRPPQSHSARTCPRKPCPLAQFWPDRVRYKRDMPEHKMSMPEDSRRRRTWSEQTRHYG